MNQPPPVVDASVAVKWVVDEAFTPQAQLLLADHVRAHQQLAGPPHLRAEVTNILYRRRLRADPAMRITEAEADQALAHFLRLPLTLLSPDGLYTQAFEFARSHQLDSIYDSLYVVLAQLAGTELWTADQRLLNTLGSRASWVRFIADYPLT